MSKKKTDNSAAAVAEDSPTYLASAPRGRHPLTCIDLFAGCGGLSLGLEQAEFHPLLFSELNKSASETYIANRAGKGIIPWGDEWTIVNVGI